MRKRHFKNEIQKLSVEYYEARLMKKIFLLMRQNCVNIKIYKIHKLKCTQFYRNYLIKKYLHQWMNVWERVKKEKEIREEITATNRYNQNLLKRCFLRLKKEREKAILRKKKTESFKKLYATIIIEFYVKFWRERTHEKLRCNELEIKAKEWRKYFLLETYLDKLQEIHKIKIEEAKQICNVIKYANKILLHRTFKGWEEVVCEKISRKIKLKNAFELQMHKLKKRTFQHWKEYILRRCQKIIATNYYKNSLLRNIINKWKETTHLKRQMLLKVAKMEKEFNQRLLKNAIKVFKNTIQTTEEKFLTATAFHRRKVLKKFFDSLKRNFNVKTVHKAQCQKNKIILNNIVIKYFIFKWYEIYLQKQSQKKRVQKIQLNSDIRVTRLYFMKWRKYIQKLTKVKVATTYFPSIKASIILQHYMEYLSTSLKQKRMIKKKIEMAVKAEEKILKRKYLHRWISFLCWKKETVTKCIEERKSFEYFQEPFPLRNSTIKFSRRQPMIPDYLKSVNTFDRIRSRWENNINDGWSDSHCSSPLRNDDTYTVIEPINKRLPVIDQNKIFLSFER